MRRIEVVISHCGFLGGFCSYRWIHRSLDRGQIQCSIGKLGTSTFNARACRNLHPKLHLVVHRHFSGYVRHLPDSEVYSGRTLEHKDPYCLVSDFIILADLHIYEIVVLCSLVFSWIFWTGGAVGLTVALKGGLNCK